MNAPVIKCAVCGKQIHTLEWWDDLETGDRVLRAYCHGAVDEMRMSPSFMLKNYNAIRQITEGVAFSTPLLTPPR